VPKPHTPFQYEPMASREEVEERRKHLMSLVKSGKVRVSRSDYSMSLMEAVLARGDRRLGKAIYSAYKNGCVLDSWDDYFDFSKWQEAFGEHGLDPAFYANRRRDYGEVAPWSHIDMLVSETFLVRENRRAHEGLTTPNCREKCANCGVGCKGACS